MNDIPPSHPSRRSVVAGALAASAAVALPWGAPPASAATALQTQAEVELRFTSPAANMLRGLTDIEVAAPAGTTAVRFSMDGIAFAELTDLYAKGTQTDPVWRTATDASWFPNGRHTLTAEADTPDGTVTAQLAVTTVRGPEGPGRTVLDGAWQFAVQAELPAGALDGDLPPAVRPDFDESAMTTILVPSSFGTVRDKWRAWAGTVSLYRRSVRLPAPEQDQRTVLTFESVYFSCRVFVNGKPVGSARGGYLPERFDITDAVTKGDNLIAVIVDNRASKEFPLQPTLYWNWGGLQESVHLDRLPPAAVTSVTAQGAADGTLVLHASGLNTTGQPRQVSTTVTVTDAAGKVVHAPTRVGFTLPADGVDAVSEAVTLRVPG
ncbi:sugar-binding domain-containing protein [Streptomyces sp. NPDC051020]|uniref:sugar-binding domain-containing protein n=1 Tax=Streptomyces sp. NPDC051020 TaxID=3155409 RepID=UPI00341EA5F8